MLFVEPGREVLVPDPGYPAYRNIVEMLGGAARSYPLKESNGYRLRSADLLGLLSTDTCAVILNGPANPTGAVPRSEELQRSLATLAERNVPFVSDEIYSGLAWEPPQPSPAEISPGGGIVVSGLSKSHAMTGWRIGWAMAPLELVEPLAAVHQHLVTCAPSISQGAALAALAPRGGRAARRIRGRLAESRELMDRELSRLAGIHYRRPDGGLYYFIQVNGCTDSERLAFSILEREQVITIPGVAFGPGGEGCLRLSFAASDEDIVAGIAGVGRVLSG
jgi:aspartate/methionine/tyrosine aminotransferase